MHKHQKKGERPVGSSPFAYKMSRQAAATIFSISASS